VGSKMMTKDPLAVVTRNNDREFSDITNWVVQALLYGEEQGITQDLTRCQNYTNLTSHVSDLNFLNAVYCVGNYIELYDGESDLDQSNRGMDQLNNGTGMLYAIPFGDLESKDYGTSILATDDSILDKLRNDQGVLNCVVCVPDVSMEGIMTNDKLVGMSVDYCRTLAAALSNGSPEAVQLFYFLEFDNSMTALNNGLVDVLAGARVERKYDFASPPQLGGFQFSTPFYYGNETLE